MVPGDLQKVELLQEVELLQDVELLQEVELLQDVEHLQDVELLQDVCKAFLYACFGRFKVELKDLSLVF